MKYLKNLTNHNAYSSFIVGSDFASIQTEEKSVVSYCKNERHVHYNPYVPVLPTASVLDILYSDANGNLSFTSDVLPISEGKTPIALCIAETGFFGDNEPARWMSLKYMKCASPEVGSLTSSSISMYWGNDGVDINTITNIQTTYSSGSNEGHLTADWIDDNTKKIPSLFNANNEWNLSVLGAVNQYAVTDIDGKNKTDLILATATSQSTWRTSSTITNSKNSGYAPPACCCARYHTLGTKAGDWYLPASGEMCAISVQKTIINEKLNDIHTLYSSNCISYLEDGFWTSTEYDSSYAYACDLTWGDLSNTWKDNQHNVIALLQY